MATAMDTCIDREEVPPLENASAPETGLLESRDSEKTSTTTFKPLSDVRTQEDLPPLHGDGSVTVEPVVSQCESSRDICSSKPVKGRLEESTDNPKPFPPLSLHPESSGGLTATLPPSHLPQSGQNLKTPPDTTRSPSPPLPPLAYVPLKRKRRIDHNTDSMELEKFGWEAKRSRVPMRDGAMLCMSVLDEFNQDSSPAEVAKELARCLHEPKYELLKDVVRVVGVEKSMELFARTAAVQESGGMIIADGSNKKKAPGGVFLSMLKEIVTDEERKEIFRRDKEICSQKEKRKRKAHKEKMRNKSIKERASRQLEIFRAELKSSSDFLPVVPGSREDRNMAKRYGPTTNREDKNINNATAEGTSTLDSVEPMEVDSNPSDSTTRKRRPSKGSEVKRNHSSGNEAEKRLADEFERLDECDLVGCHFDFGT